MHWQLLTVVLIVAAPAEDQSKDAEKFLTSFKLAR